MNRLDLRQLREECSDVIAVSWVNKMYSELDAPTQAILHVLDDLVITDIRTVIANLDIVLKEGCVTLLMNSNPDTIELLLKFFDDLLTELISDKSFFLFVCDGSYVLTDLELSILLSTFISKSGDANSKIRIAVKGFYQSIVACADRSKALFLSTLHSIDDAGPPALFERTQRTHSTNHTHFLQRNDSLSGSQTGSPRKHHGHRPRSLHSPRESCLDGR